MTALVFSPQAFAEVAVVDVQDGGQLVYASDAKGNRVPDFSHCGYRGANQQIPEIPAAVFVRPGTGDDTTRIQAAIDHVGGLPRGPHGFRGAVLLAPGQFDVAGHLTIGSSGLVIRGSGMGPGGTVLRATGIDRRPLLQVSGQDDRTIRPADVRHVMDDYVPAGATSLQLNSAAGFGVGDTIVITRPSTAEWIRELGMDAFGIAWKPGTRDIQWDRTVIAIDGNTIEFDVPLTTALDTHHGGATVARYTWPGRLENVGIENLRLESEYDRGRPADEDHAWFGITLQNVRDAWVRRIEFRHFAGGAVALWENTCAVTVSDCKALLPVSEVAGYRRHTFFTMGQQTLFLRCWSRHGRHDFAVGHCAAGPNAFVWCTAEEAHSHSGPIESWASGVLYDNVRIDGAGLALDNRFTAAQGAGWSAANSVLWQCRAATIRCFSPPTARNWAVGVWGQMLGNGEWQGRNEFVRPSSLFAAQLNDRIGKASSTILGAMPQTPTGATNPSPPEAAALVANSNQPAATLDAIIDQLCQDDPLDTDSGGAVDLDMQLASQSQPRPRRATASEKGRLAVASGWLVVNERLRTGGLLSCPFWRGTIRPLEAITQEPALTRFVPGRVGPGFTDDLHQVAEQMIASNIAVLEHHHGLWYDRRRDDHQMERRESGDAWPPFYEQPFSRSGRGRAWDGLSKYDLTAPNPWYWTRLRAFAEVCEARGLILFHQHYFQHNLLEAGAHWADFPWRSANNVNETGFPEPPPYAGDKRIFQAHLFYDVSNLHRRGLHRAYIRQSLQALADRSNVLHLIGGEFTGPLEFLQFWIDTISEWTEETGQDVLVGLSCTQDVQDAILQDPLRGPHVDVIDIRYWTYSADGTLYAPQGGKNLSPRQHLRQIRPVSSSFASIARAVQEVRRQFPDRAVTYYADLHCHSPRDGWAVLMGGGSLPMLPPLPSELAQVIPTLRPTDDVTRHEWELRDDQWCLSRRDRQLLIYTAARDEAAPLTIPGTHASYRVVWIDPRSARLSAPREINAGETLHVPDGSSIVWLSRQDVD